MLPIDLTGKHAFVAGVADDMGFGFAIAKALAEAGATIHVGTWPPALNLFRMSLERGKFDASLKLSNGKKMEFANILPLDAIYDKPEDVPETVREDKRYRELQRYTVSESAVALKEKLGEAKLDVLIHSLANGSEVKKPLLETSRSGYLAALSASAYSFISLCQSYGPIMSAGASALALSYMAGLRVVPGYGGGMSSAKAALESDMRYLAYEMGRAYKIRVNAISAGPLSSRAAKAIGFIDRIKEFTVRNQPLERQLEACDVGATAAFLSSPLAASITGSVVYVDNGYHAMGVPVSEKGMPEGDITSIHTRADFKPPA